MPAWYIASLLLYTHGVIQVLVSGLLFEGCATCSLLNAASPVWVRLPASMASGPTGKSPFGIASYLLFVIYGVLILTITICCQGMTNACGYILQREDLSISSVTSGQPVLVFS